MEPPRPGDRFVPSRRSRHRTSGVRDARVAFRCRLAVPGHRRDRQRHGLRVGRAARRRARAARTATSSTEIDAAGPLNVLRRRTEPGFGTLARHVPSWSAHAASHRCCADGRPVAHVVVGGFVTSTRDRRRLWELLSARGRARGLGAPGGQVDHGRAARRGRRATSRWRSPAPEPSWTRPPSVSRRPSASKSCACS